MTGRVLGALLLVVSVLGGSACGGRDGAREDAQTADDEAAVQRVALITLFVTREHARQLVFWNDRLHLSPTLRLLRDAGVPLVAQTADTAALRLPMPVHLESLTSLEAHFRRYPDGWEAWFRRYPGSSGLVALTRPTWLPAAADGSARAALVVGRTCGEHCHSAWRLTLARHPGAPWRSVSVVPIALPRD
ncbi:MAG: hypothetical protein P3C12_14265 [Gemmatimonadota bacterium]|nr:hypothetical protein [Gemmatimonadota bacterium]